MSRGCSTEHRQILDLCRKRDAERAAKLVDEHIVGACESLKTHLPKGAACPPDAVPGRI
ncbi:FCD domain-containing protein [Rhizobium anhuiense]|uniref:FCD domain-containing protein n=1 Tax=Rhizobium anhuiense TaxID=1184720 RepID=UPI00117A4323